MGERWRPYRSVATWYIWRRNAGKTPDAKSEEPITDRAEAAVKAATKTVAVRKTAMASAKKTTQASRRSSRVFGN